MVTFSIGSNVPFPIGTIMGERLFFLPSAGLCLLAGVGWQRVGEWRQGVSSFKRVRRMGLGLVGVIVVLFAARTVVRNRDWRDEQALFESAMRVSPNSAKVHLGLGGVYLEKGLTDAALRELQISLAILPTVMAQSNLGTLYLRKGQSGEAIAEYRKALALDPRHALTYNNLGYVLLSRGEIGEAVEALQKAVLFGPHLADAHYTLGRALAAQERWAQAIAAYREACRLKPDFVEAAYALGLALEASGQYREAAQAFEGALRLRPGLTAAHRRLAKLYRARLGDPEKAQEHLRQAEEGK